MPSFSEWQEMLGDKAQTFRRLLFSLLLARNRFPRCFLLPFVGWNQKQVLTARVKRLENR